MQDINKNSLTVICENTVNNSEEFQSSSELLVQEQKHQFSFLLFISIPFL